MFWMLTPTRIISNTKLTARNRNMPIALQNCTVLFQLPRTEIIDACVGIRIGLSILLYCSVRGNNTGYCVIFGKVAQIAISSLLNVSEGL